MAGRYAGKQMAKRAVGKEFKRQSKHLATPANNSLLVDMSGVTPRPLSEFSSLSDAELAKLLPDYAHPNWQGDGFKLVKERLWNGGFDRLEKPSKEQEAELAYNVRQYFKRPEGRDYFRKSRATEQTARGTQIKNYYGLNEGN